MAGSVFPVDPPRVTGLFNNAEPPYSEGNTHNGLDLSPRRGAFGEPIYASFNGRVLNKGYSASFGNWILIQYVFKWDVWARDKQDIVRTIAAGTPVYVYYAHMQESSMLNPVSEVKAGQIIGLIGATGEANGAHVHIDARMGSISQENRVNFLDILHANIVGLDVVIVYA